MSTTHTIIDSPIGELTLVATDGTLCGVYFPGHWTRPDRAAFGEWSNRGFEQVERQLAEYFAGVRKTFELPLAAVGSPFQRRVWDALREIPYGETATYGGMAMALGSGPRPIGMACARNPIPIIVPCHRVLASGGKEGGFSGGKGLPTKRQLLALEGVVLL